jgi:hypothetical protein
LIDSGATNHMTEDEGLFTSLIIMTTLRKQSSMEIMVKEMWSIEVKLLSQHQIQLKMFIMFKG